jgi:hypothetical protein
MSARTDPCGGCRVNRHPYRDSGYVDENTKGAQAEPGTDCPEPVNASAEGNGQTTGSEVRSPASGVGNGGSAEVKQAAAHGSIPNSAFRIPEKRGIEVGGERSAVLDRK